MGRRAQSEEFHFEGFEYPTTTPVPDVIFDAFLSRLGEAELKALLYIVRRTFGFKKDRDAISFNQFLRGIKTREGQVLDEGCGVKDRTTLSRALQSLEAKGIIHSEKGIDARGENETTVYSLRFKGDARPAVVAPTPSQEVVGNSYHPMRINQGGVVGNSYQGGREHPSEVVGIPYHRSRENPPGVVGFAYPQQTVIQETEGGEISNIRKDAPFFLGVDNFVDNFVDNPDALTDTVTAEPFADSWTANLGAIAETFTVPAPVVVGTVCESTHLPMEEPRDPAPSAVGAVRTDAGRADHRSAIASRGAPSVAKSPPAEPGPKSIPSPRQRDAAQGATAHAEAPGLSPDVHEPRNATPGTLALPLAFPALPVPVGKRRVVPEPSLDVHGPTQERIAATPVDYATPYDPAREMLARFVEDFAREFNDQAPLRSTLSRLANLYQRSALPMETFVTHLYAARQTTQERTGAIRTRAGEGSTKNKMVYFFGVLENHLGFRDHAESSDLAAMFARSDS